MTNKINDMLIKAKEEVEVTSSIDLVNRAKANVELVEECIWRDLIKKYVYAKTYETVFSIMYEINKDKNYFIFRTKGPWFETDKFEINEDSVVFIEIKLNEQDESERLIPVELRQLINDFKEDGMHVDMSYNDIRSIRVSITKEEIEEKINQAVLKK